MRPVVAWMVVGLLLVSGAGLAVAEELKPATRISQDLAELVSPRAAASLSTQAEPGAIEAPATPILDLVTIDATASDDPDVLAADLNALGAERHADRRSARLGPDARRGAALPETLTSLRFAWPAYAATNVGSVTSQGDVAMRADVARKLSASTAPASRSVCSPTASMPFAGGGRHGDRRSAPTVMVLQESPCSSGCNTDEGRAMLEIVHDVAPGRALAFATAQRSGGASPTTSGRCAMRGPR